MEISQNTALNNRVTGLAVPAAHRGEINSSPHVNDTVAGTAIDIGGSRQLYFLKPGSILPQLPEVENISTGGQEPLTLRDKVKKLRQAGFRFNTARHGMIGKEATDQQVVDEYTKNRRAPGSMIARTKNQRIELPGRREDIDLLLFYYLDGQSQVLSEPPLAELIKKVYERDKAADESGFMHQSFSLKYSNPVTDYAQVKALGSKPDFGSQLHFKDGEKTIQIMTRSSFERACFLTGALPEKELDPQEREAYGLITDMQEKGFIFNNSGGGEACLLEIMNSAGDGEPGVYTLDSEGRKEKVTSYKELKRVHSLHVTKDFSTLPAGEKELLLKAQELIDNGLCFTSYMKDGTPHGAATVVKSVLGEKTGIIGNYVYLKDERKKYSALDSPADLARIKSMYIEKDTSSLPTNEQRIIESMEEIFDCDDFEPDQGTLGMLKSVLGENRPGYITIGSQSGSREKLSSPADLHRFRATYMNKDRELLTPDEGRAVEKLEGLRAAGVSFTSSGGERQSDMKCLQVLSGDEKSPDKLIVYHPQEKRTRINRLEDLSRLEGLWIKKDLSLLAPEDRELISQLRELRNNDILIKGDFDKSELGILKAVKGELGKAFMEHQESRESALEDPPDFQRLKALYVTGDLDALPAGDKELIDSINLLGEKGFSCAELTCGVFLDIEPFAQLKAALKNKQNRGLREQDGTFTEAASAEDLIKLRELEFSPYLNAFSPHDQKIIKIIRTLRAEGYSFECATESHKEYKQGQFEPVMKYYPVGTLTVLKAFNAEKEGLWLNRNGTKIPLAKVREFVEIYEDLRGDPEEAAGNETEIIENRDFIIVDGLKLPKQN